MQREEFAPVYALAERLRGFSRPWVVAGGWALDLFVARRTRTHADIEIMIYRHDQHALRRFLQGWTFTKVIPPAPGRVEWWPAEEWLSDPIHEAYARWVGADSDELEILLDECDDRHWVYRRDSRVTRHLAMVHRSSPDGIPFLAPEIVLLYKAKEPRGRDEADFAIAAGQLDDDARDWLRHALATCHPEHHWIAAL